MTAAPTAGGVVTSGVGVAGVGVGLLGMFGPVRVVHVGWLLPLSGVHIELDRLGGFFMALTGAVAAPVGCYLIGYVRREHLGRVPMAVVPLFVAAMLLVPAAGSVTTFLLAWELMAIASLILVLSEHARPHRQRAPLPGLRRAGRTDRAGGREVNVMSYLAGAAQIGGVMVGAPLVIGMTRQVRARWEGRAGAGLLQPWRDLLKQLGKQQITPAGTTIVFAAAPVIVAGTTLLIAAIAPLVATGSPLDPSADLFAVVGLLFLGTVALTLAGIDTGTSFGGMGASREITIAALVEPTILLAVFALSIPAGSANLGALVASTIDHPGHVVSLAGVLAFVALVIVIVAETGRLPVDNPATHLELTMVHEAMVLEYAGPRLALVEWAAGMRLTVLLALLANLFLPWGIAGAAPTALDVLTGVVAVAAKVAILAVLLATFEVFLAKLRLFRVPELLAGSFLLALLAVTAANFFTVGA